MSSSPSRHTEKTGQELSWVADVGGSHVTAAIVDSRSASHILGRTTASIATHGDAAQILGSITETLHSTAPNAPRWTIAFPGPFDYDRGIGSFEGVSKFQALAGLDLRAQLSSLLGPSAPSIRFVNDAIAYGAGEWWVSPGRPDRFVCLTLGTGVGSAFLDQGRPVEAGEEVPPHGWAHLLEIGGRPLEDAVSTRAIQKRFGEASGESLSVREIAERARNDDDTARSVLDDAMVELGTALGPWIARFAASDAVVGGSMARSWDVLGPAFERAVRETSDHPVTIRASSLFDDAPLIGAAILA